MYDINKFFLFFSVVVTASFDRANYSVSEEDEFIEGCVVLDGLIHRDVVIQLSTVDSSATGIMIF